MKTPLVCLLILGLSVFLLGTGCGVKETEGISKEEYREVMSLVKERLRQDAEGVILRIGWRKTPVKLEHGGWPVYGNPDWFIKVRKGINIIIRKSEKRSPNPVPFSRSRMIRITRKAIRRACRKTGVSYEDFNRAHAQFGRLGLTYQAEREELGKLLKELYPKIKKVVGKDEVLEHVKALHPYNTFQILPSIADSLELERAAQLAYDLGLPLNGEPRFLIEVDEKGLAWWKGESQEWEMALKETTAKAEVGFLVHITVKPQLSIKSLFTTVESVYYCGAQRIGISEKLSRILLVMSPSSTPIGRVDYEEYMRRAALENGVFIEIPDDERIIVDEKEIDVSKVSIDSLLESHLKDKKHPMTFILVDEDVSCRTFFHICLAAARYGGIMAYSDALHEPLFHTIA
ncbi:hypothetical protein JXM67_01960 [candidate division WOR-3 bacterium]|nr:hypothetical protein [candidate division WOR-3 bacterium]